MENIKYKNKFTEITKNKSNFTEWPISEYITGL